MRNYRPFIDFAANDARPDHRAAVLRMMKRIAKGATHALVSIAVIFSTFLNAVPVESAACSFTEDGNGDVIIGSDCEIAAGTYNITRDFIIQAGVTVTAQGNTGGGTGVIINAGRDISIASTAILTADFQGFTQETGPGAGNNDTDANAGTGGGHGGEGGNTGVPTNGRGAAYGSVTAPVTLGSGGGDDEFGGDQGGTGGGAIKLSATAGTVTIDGIVSANGQNGVGSGDGGGGAGGSIWVDASTIAGTGTIRVNGGSSITNEGGGGGGGGRIAVTYVTGTPTNYTLQAFGGNGGLQSGFNAEDGGAGTIFLKSSVQTNGDLILDNNNRDDSASTPQIGSASQTFDNVTISSGAFYSVPNTFTLVLATSGVLSGTGSIKGTLFIDSGATFTPPSGTLSVDGVNFAGTGSISTVTSLTLLNSTWTFVGAFLATLADLTLSSGSNWLQDVGTTVPDDLTVQNGATWTQNHANTVTFGTVTVESGGTITHCNNSTTKACEVDIAATTFDLQAGGIISGDGLGYDGNQGPGAGTAGANSGGGGGHGGKGGRGGNAAALGGDANDDVAAPIDLGSGGASDEESAGQPGGGAVRLDVSGTFSLNGTITADGTNSPTFGDAGAGAGGSVYITAATITGTGGVGVDGGLADSNDAGGGGAGGRIAIHYDTDTSSLNFSAHGGFGGNQSGFEGQDGGAGTVYLKDNAATFAEIIVDNDGRDEEGLTPQLGASETYSTITIADGANYQIPATRTLTVAPGGTFTGGGAAQSELFIADTGTFDPNVSTFSFTNIDVTNDGIISDVTSLTVNDSAFLHRSTGTFSSTVSTLTVTGASTFTHQGSGLSITNGANFTLNGGSTFTHDSATGFSPGLDITFGSATFNAINTSFDDQSSLTIQTGGTFVQQHLSTIDIGTLTVQSGGSITHAENSSTHAFEVDIASTTIDIQSGASVIGDGRGFVAPNGPGVGTTGAGEGAGGGYGGKGGDGNNGRAGGVAYGSVTQPSDIGSAGGGDNNAGGSTVGGDGGGAIKLVASGTLTVNGTLSANGNATSTDDAGGGSGGSVWLDAGTLAGTGTIRANGGNANLSGAQFGGGGGGGRIAIHYTNGNPLSFVLQAFGGAEGTGTGSEEDGAAGTVYLKSLSQTNGDLLVRNNNRTDSAATSAVGTGVQTYDNITVGDGALYSVLSSQTLELAIGGTLSGGGTQQSTIDVRSGGILDLNSASQTVTGVDIDNFGVVATMTSLTLNDSTFTHDGDFSATLGSVTMQSAGKFLVRTTTGLSLSSATVQSGGTLEQGMLTTLPITTLTVQSGGNVTHTNNTTAKLYVVDIAASTIDIQTGGTVIVDGFGFSDETGPGAGDGDAQSGIASGGGHGGDGGDSGANQGGASYGSVTQPIDIGSGGGHDNSSGAGSPGGGAIKLSASSSFTNNGTISANGFGTVGDDAGGGAGGSVWIDADGASIAGTGIIRAEGDDANLSGGQFGGGGGGGRIAVYYGSGDPNAFTLSVKGGRKGTSLGTTTGDGGSGTIFLKSDAQPNGDLIIGNNNETEGNFTTQVNVSETYDNITIKEGANYDIPNGSTLTLAVGGTLTGGGTTNGELKISVGGTFDPNASIFAFRNMNVNLDGAMSDVTDLTIENSDFDHDGNLSSTVTDLTFDAGSSGAIFRNNGTGFNDLTLVVGNSGTFVAETTGYTGLTSLSVLGTGTFQQNHTGTIDIGSVTVSSGGTITHGDNSTARSFVVDITATTVDIQAGGEVTGDGRGFNNDLGPGAGNNTANANCGSGGGYGGTGGNACSNIGGTTYGSETMPVDLGSGGGDESGGAGTPAGGAVKIIVSGALTVNGTITVNGVNGSGNDDAGAGSGGSIWLQGDSIAGTGTLSADGGDAFQSGNFGGGGGGGRIAVYYGTGDPNNWTITSDAGIGGNGGGGNDGNVGTIYLEQTATGPTITAITHTPSNPTTGDPVTLSATAIDDTGVTKIDLYLNGTPPGSGLVHTCNFAPAQTPATCEFNVGALSNQTHTFTAIATDEDTTTGSDTDVFSINGQTSSGTLTFSRLAAGATNVSLAMVFTLSAADTGSLTVTFPAQFTITSAFTTGSCSGGGTIDTFGFTSTTLTATKNSCAGTVSLSGAVLTNPATPGEYLVTWSNDSGSAVVVIVDDDQVNVSGDVDPELSFNVGSQASATACDGTFSGNGGTLPLGSLTTASVASSDASSVPHVCTRVTTNSTGGATISVRSLNAALASIANPGDAIASSTATLVAGTEGYGMCVGSSGTDTGTDVTTPTGATPTRSAPFNSTCTATDHNVGGLTTSLQSLFTLSGASQNAFARIYLKAAISPGTPAHDDYTDVLTFIVSAEY